MRELTPDWATTAKALSKSNKLELSADGMKVKFELSMSGDDLESKFLKFESEIHVPRE